MGTRAAAFTAKVRSLNDFYHRLLQAVVPLPSGLDIANTLKYFSQTLLGVLRDIQEQPFVIMRHRDQDANRLALFPSLEYSSLYQALVQLIDTIPLVQVNAEGAPSIEENMENYAQVSVPAVIMMVLQYTDNTAYHCQLLESLMSLKSDVIKDLLCVIAYGTPCARPFAANLLFHYWPNLNPTLFDRRGIHIRFSDISNVLKAMFSKPALGVKTESVSQSVVSESGEIKPPKGWKPLHCQVEGCGSEGAAEAVKICYDHVVSLSASPECPPPLHLCHDCADDIHNEHNSAEFFDIVLPISQVSSTCENKNCRSSEKNAVATCFSIECASYNSNRPIRYCSQCNKIRHNNRRGMDHVVLSTIGSPWTVDSNLQSLLIEAIISLLNEAQFLADKNRQKDQDRLNKAGLLDDVEDMGLWGPEDRRLLSRYGVWLIVGLCAPTEDTPKETLGYLLSALFEWFNATQYQPDNKDDPQGSSIERLKNELLHNWLQEICKTHFDIFASCLLPHPPEYARVGGHWDTLSSRSDHVKEGFRRLYSLVPYELVSLKVWEKIMPYWMEAIESDVLEDELISLKITLSKLLDPEMSPLGFDASQMYNFIAIRFINTPYSLQKQTLSWLQKLSSLCILIPLYQILKMFNSGVNLSDSHTNLSRKISLSIKHEIFSVEPGEENEFCRTSALFDDDQPQDEDPESYTDPELNLTCFVLMLDILLKQMEVQDMDKHKGLSDNISQEIIKLIQAMLSSSCLISHICEEDKECTTCELMATFFQLAVDIISYLCPQLAVQNDRVADLLSHEPKECPDLSKVTESSADEKDSDMPTVSQPSLVQGAKEAVCVASSQVVTATEETVGELDIVANIPQEQVVQAVARAVTLTDADVAHATVSVALASVVGENDEPVDPSCLLHEEEESEFWVTSQGKFKFKLDELSAHLRVIYILLERLEVIEDAEVIYHVCECLKYLILHGKSFAEAALDQRGLLIWCQENKTVRLMWSLIDAEWSQIAEICVSLLLHFITLPCGADIFWKLCETNFHHTDWKIRFQAVEKVVVIGRFLTMSSVRDCPKIQAAVAHAFCFLIMSLDDINVSVSQRAALYLTSLPDSGLRALCWCLEQQFDSIIMDRPMILQVLHQLSSCLPDRKVLSWEFFYSRFDALYIEAQLALEKHGDIAFPRDLRNSDMTSDVFTRKLGRAQDAISLAQSSSVRTLSSSLGTKWPYKRTMSAPANILNKVEKGSSKLSGASHPADTGMKFGDEGSMVHQIQRAMDLEEIDKDTLHLLIFLFMQYLSRPQHTGEIDDKGGNKLMFLVLRHISILMGFNPQERQFTISPNKLRFSPVFNAFLTNLPTVLDYNYKMGTLLLPTCLPVLQYCAAPYRVLDLKHPIFSLWCLQPQPRHCWLMSVLTILYKYQYAHHPVSQQIFSLIKIVLNTLDNQFHCCHKVEPTNLLHGTLSYSREHNKYVPFFENTCFGMVTPSSLVCKLMQSVDSTHDKEEFVFMSGVHQPHQFTHTLEDGATVPKTSSASLKSQDDAKASPVSEVVITRPIPKKITPSCSPVDQLQPIVQSIQLQDSVCDVEACGDINDDKEQEMFAEALAVQCSDISFSATKPVVANASIVMPPAIHAHAVTTVVASQIQASQESFTVTIHNTQLAQGDSVFRMNSTQNHASPKNFCLVESYPEIQQPYSVEDDSELSLSSEQDILLRSSFETDTSSASENIFTIGAGGAFKPYSYAQEYEKFSAHNHSKHTNSCRKEVAKNSWRHHKSEHSEYESKFSFDSNGHPSSLQPHSPQSPLSLMDVMTLGSPVEIDCQTSTTFESPSTEVTSPPEILELPTPERLIQIGSADSSRIDTQSDQNIRNMCKNKIEKSLINEEVTPAFANSVEPASRVKNKLSSSIVNLRKSEYPWTNLYAKSPVGISDDNQGGQGPPPPPSASSIRQSLLRTGDDCIVNRCMECGEILEEFSNSDIGICIIILSTFVHRESALAAQLLPKMLHTIAKVASSEVFSWQYDLGIHLPGSSTSIGRQFLRCVLHQLAPNQIFNQIFQTNVDDIYKMKLFKAMSQALADFNHLTPSAPIVFLLENYNSKKVLPTENLSHVLGNVAAYMECVNQEGVGGLSTALLPLLDTFLRKLVLSLHLLDDPCPLIRILICMLKIPGVAGQKERDKLEIARLVIMEFIQTLKFKTTLPDVNLVCILQLIVQDSGGTLCENNILDGLPKSSSEIQSLPATCAAEVMRSHLHDALEFIADVHTLTKVKSTCTHNVSLNEDTLGGIIKAGIAQYLALEISHGCNKDSKTLQKYLPWLSSTPTLLQQGAKEFLDCVGHTRLLSWIILGALMHSCLVGSSGTTFCQPVPAEASCHIADHIQVVLTGFPEQSKASVLHMSSLFHAFFLCQLWTVYLEQIAGSPGTDMHNITSAILTDFWSKVTPGILQLVAHSKVLGETVNFHFLSLMEALLECKSTILSKLLPLWSPVLNTHLSKIPGQVQVRIEACLNMIPVSAVNEDGKDQNGNRIPSLSPSNYLLKWLLRLQFRMGQIELQSATATQIYSV